METPADRRINGPISCRVYLPAHDFKQSTKFYELLGFKIVVEAKGVNVMSFGQVTILLQDYYVKELAENLMLQLWVDDLDAWWELITQTRICENHKRVKAKPPEDYPWGLREIHLTDPSGVFWHIVQDTN